MVNQSSGRSILIIGAGIGGLSAGCYGQMNGYRTQIFEQHDKPGGLCTSWKRKGYTFDGCIAVGVAGSASDSSSHRVWEELGALRGREVFDREEYLRFVGANGERLILYADVDKLEQHLHAAFPADGVPIQEFCDAVRLFSRLDMPPDKPKELYGLRDNIRMLFRMLPFLRAWIKYGGISVQEFAGRFRDPFLKEAFAIALHFDTPEPMLSLILCLAWMNGRNAGFPAGGSLEFSEAIERRYLDLGGQIRYKTRVEQVLVDEEDGLPDRAVGIRLSNGTVHRADIVISAADGHATIFKMLDGRYLNDEIRGYYEGLPVFPSIVQVSMGVNRDLSHEPSDIKYFLAEPVSIAGEERDHLLIRHYCYDPSLAPPGKSVLIVQLPSAYEYWKGLRDDRERYEGEKQAVSAAIIEQLERRFPGITKQIEVVDVSTPTTTERYTGNWRGSIMGWLSTTETADIDNRRTLPNLENFYLVGQWAEPRGGLPSVAMSGRNVMQIICSKDGKSFVAPSVEGKTRAERRG
jgi:phytoene dehydrogenase-like protein